MTRDACDLVIIGAGLAGLVAALGALDQGMRVHLIDRDGPEATGGLARRSFGGLLVVDSPLQRRAGLRDSPERALADWLRFGEITPDQTLRRDWAASYCADSRVMIHDWLSAMGQRFLPLPLWVEREGNSLPRWHVCWGTGAGLVARILGALEAHPNRARLSLRHHARAEALIQSAGRITGVSGVDEQTGAAWESHAPRVVIATGGLNGDPATRRAQWHPDWAPTPPQILSGAHRFADGRMHRAAAARGASVIATDRNWNYAAGIRHWAPETPDHGLSLVPARHALWVDEQGARIWPPMVSGFDTRDLLARLCRAGGAGWQVMNRRIMLKELSVSGAAMNPAIRDGSRLRLLRDLLLGNRWLYRTLRDNAPDMVLAETLPELVAKMNAVAPGVDEARLRADLTGFDAAIARRDHSDPQLAAIARLRDWRGDKMRLVREGQRILDPAAGPLVALRTLPIARKSLGGIVSDLSGRALDETGAPIPGLYAIGEAAGFGGGNANGLRGLEGTFLGGAIYTARRLSAAIASGD